MFKRKTKLLQPSGQGNSNFDGVEGHGMMTKGGSVNLGDPKRFLRKGIGSANPANREERVKGALEVGSVHSRANTWRNLGEVLDEREKAKTLEGTDRFTKRDRETSATHRSGLQTATRLERIAKVARADKRYKFRALASLLSKGYLAECFAELKRNKAPGIDGVTLDEYGLELEKNLGDLVARMKARKYKPLPVRRTYIPKESGGKRPLGIPALEDKVVQMGITKILEAMFEPNFLEVSYGYRKGRSCHDALNAVDKAIMTKPVSYIVDADIKAFFDNVDHNWMQECLKQRISDENFLRLVVRFLKAGIMEEGKFFDTEKGTPQGGILSPVLSNIYLHYVLDLWVEKRLKKECTGHVEQIRYADDFLICTQRKLDAEKILEALRERLSKFGLTLSDEKTRLIGFGRFARTNAEKLEKKAATFDFLGFTHYCDRTRRGKFKVGRRTSRKKFQMKLSALNEWMSLVRNKMNAASIWDLLKRKLEGHYRYYGVSGNFSSIWSFYHHAKRIIFRWMNQRSQKRSFSWKRYQQYLATYPLPRPKIYHNLYSLELGREYA